MNQWPTTTTTTSSSASVTYTWTARWLDHWHIGGWWGIADAIGHKLHLPRAIQHPICDHFELAVGITLDQLRGDYPDGLPWWLRPPFV